MTTLRELTDLAKEIGLKSSEEIQPFVNEQQRQQHAAQQQQGEEEQPGPSSSSCSNLSGLFSSPNPARTWHSPSSGSGSYYSPKHFQATSAERSLRPPSSSKFGAFGSKANYKVLVLKFNGSERCGRTAPSWPCLLRQKVCTCNKHFSKI